MSYHLAKLVNQDKLVNQQISCQACKYTLLRGITIKYTLLKAIMIMPLLKQSIVNYQKLLYKV